MLIVTKGILFGLFITTHPCQYGHSTYNGDSDVVEQCAKEEKTWTGDHTTGKPSPKRVYLTVVSSDCMASEMNHLRVDHEAQYFLFSDYSCHL